MDLAEHRKNLETLRETVDSFATIIEGIAESLEGAAHYHPEVRAQLRAAAGDGITRIATASVMIAAALDMHGERAVS